MPELNGLDWNWGSMWSGGMWGGTPGSGGASSAGIWRGCTPGAGGWGDDLSGEAIISPFNPKGGWGKTGSRSGNSGGSGGGAGSAGIWRGCVPGAGGWGDDLSGDAIISPFNPKGGLGKTGNGSGNSGGGGGSGGGTAGIWRGCMPGGGGGSFGGEIFISPFNPKGGPIGRGGSGGGIGSGGSGGGSGLWLGGNGGGCVQGGGGDLPFDNGGDIIWNFSGGKGGGGSGGGSSGFWPGGNGGGCVQGGGGDLPFDNGGDIIWNFSGGKGGGGSTGSGNGLWPGGNGGGCVQGGGGDLPFDNGGDIIWNFSGGGGSSGNGGTSGFWPGGNGGGCVQGGGGDLPFDDGGGIIWNFSGASGDDSGDSGGADFPGDDDGPVTGYSFGADFPDDSFGSGGPPPAYVTSGLVIDYVLSVIKSAMGDGTGNPPPSASNKPQNTPDDGGTYVPGPIISPTGPEMIGAEEQRRLDKELLDRIEAKSLLMLAPEPYNPNQRPDGAAFRENNGGDGSALRNHQAQQAFEEMNRQNRQNLYLPGFVGGRGSGSARVPNSPMFGRGYAWGAPTVPVPITPSTTPGGAATPHKRRSLYHYTDEAGLNGITQSNSLRASTKASNPNDVRYGNGQYVSDFAPGTKTPAQLSREFLRIPWQGKRFTHYIEIDVTGLEVIQGRKGVFVIPNNVPLDLNGRIIDSGKVPLEKPGG